MIDAMPEEAAVQFLKSHVSPTNYPSVRGPTFAGLPPMPRTGTGLALVS